MRLFREPEHQSVDPAASLYLDLSDEKLAPHRVHRSTILPRHRHYSAIDRKHFCSGRPILARLDRALRLFKPLRIYACKSPKRIELS